VLWVPSLAAGLESRAVASSTLAPKMNAIAAMTL
jgi:hypothetical protein